MIVYHEANPDYAGALCEECCQFVKLLNRAQYDDFRMAEEARGTSLRRARDQRKRENAQAHVFTEEEIREIVQDELKKARESLAD